MSRIRIQKLTSKQAPYYVVKITTEKEKNNWKHTGESKHDALIFMVSTLGICIHQQPHAKLHSALY